MNNLIAAERHLNCNIFITGGYVRDLLIGRVNKDIDMICVGVPLTKLHSYLSKVAKSSLTKADGNVVLIYGENKDAMQITSAKGSGDSVTEILKADSALRDFRCNSMYLKLSDIGDATKVIDYVDGRSDIESAVIRFNNNPGGLIEASPIRMLRAVSLSAKLKFELHEGTAAAIRNRASLINSCPKEAIQAEVNDILVSEKPSKGINLMLETMLLKHILPELYRCVGVEQSKEHHLYNVYEHILHVVDNCCNDLILRLAGLFHDVGKPVVAKMINGKMSFHNHESVGAKITSKAMLRLRYSNDTISKVTSLVENHMYHYDREWTDSAVRRFIRNVGLTVDDIEKGLRNFQLFKLRVADRLGNGLKPKGVTDKQKDFEKRITELCKKDTCLSIKSLAINGNDLMDTFDLSQGRVIGCTLKVLLEAVIDDPSINNRDSLLLMVRDIVSKYNNGSM